MASRQGLLNHLREIGVLKSAPIIAAFQKIDRADFIFSEHQHLAYEDFPLTIGYGATNSQPYTVAFMLELLQPRVGEKILDVGSGSGWTTALLAELVGKEGRVFGIEIVPTLVEFGRQNLAKYQFPWAQIIQAQEKKLGLPKKAPFDKILVSAAAWQMPNELVDQLTSPGRMVIPIRNSIWRIDKNNQAKISSREFPGFAFVPLR